MLEQKGHDERTMIFVTMAVVAAGVFFDDDVWRQTLVTALACVESSHCSDRMFRGYDCSPPAPFPSLSCTISQMWVELNLHLS